MEEIGGQGECTWVIKRGSTKRGKTEREGEKWEETLKIGKGCVMERKEVSHVKIAKKSYNVAADKEKINKNSTEQNRTEQNRTGKNRTELR
ncbi:hypothetical protein POVCU2_0085660 [Plasmodium ovale curtisi]|uniref:Uncharacterized protein n=1 Tax=Plasmodium ovale curtisi TaxID=864141 RepID=A0A1A8WRU7_PLAOA|nr:hypothetical protein POVCU2_0085660 [Plasmodium ovale curtisi]